MNIPRIVNNPHWQHLVFRLAMSFTGILCNNSAATTNWFENQLGQSTITRLTTDAKKGQAPPTDKERQISERIHKLEEEKERKAWTQPMKPQQKQSAQSAIADGEQPKALDAKKHEETKAKQRAEAETKRQAAARAQQATKVETTKAPSKKPTNRQEKLRIPLPPIPLPPDT